MNCKTCIHWVEKEDRYNSVVRPYNPATETWCENEEEAARVFGHPVRYCNAPKLLFYQRPEPNGAAVMDGSEYMADLVTGPEFGCVLHEAREGKQ